MELSTIQELFGKNNVQHTGSSYFGNTTPDSDLDIVVLIPPDSLEPGFERKDAFSYVANVLSTTGTIPCITDDYEDIDSADHFVFTLKQQPPMHLIVVTSQREFEVWRYLSKLFKIMYENLAEIFKDKGYRKAFSTTREALVNSDVEIPTENTEIRLIANALL